MSEALGYANAVNSGRRGGNGSRDRFQRLQPHRDGRLGSTKAGDLRVAHFVGLHALQALPIAGAIIDPGAARQAWSARSWLPGGVALLWASVVIGLLLQALDGRPVLG